MRREKENQSRVIEGHFRLTQVERSRHRRVAALLTVGILLFSGFALQSPLLISVAIGLGIASVFLIWRGGRLQRVKVRLAGSVVSVSGADYDIQVGAPFRYQTGVERIRATSKNDELCFVRMVIDVHGRPLVFEEEVLTGYIPPDLEEIAGKSSALGIAELTSLTPYPGTLWSIIERLGSYAHPSEQTKLEDDVESLLRIGRQQLANEQYQQALDTFSTVVKLRPDSPAAYYSRGEARYHLRQDLDKAINDLTTAVRLDPKHHQAFQMRGLVQAQNGNWAGLRDDCSLALRLRPRSAELYILRGTACYRLQDFDAAMANFEQAISIDRSRYESYYNLGLTKRQQGKLLEAMADFQHALKLNPDFDDAQRHIASLTRQIAQREAGSSA